MKLITFLNKHCHLKKDTVMCDSFEIDYIEEASLHLYFNTFYWKYVGSQKCEKKFLKIKYLESLLELVLKNCGTVFNENYVMLIISLQEAVLRDFQM